jgi:hypothetical protein
MAGHSTFGIYYFCGKTTQAAVSAAKTDGRRRTSTSIDDGCDELTLIFFARHRAQASWERRSRRGSPPPPLPLPVPPSPDAPASSVFLRFLLGAGAVGGGGKARAGDMSWSSSPLESIFIAGAGITLLPLGPSRLGLALLLGGNTSPMATRSRSRSRSNIPT